MKKAVRGQEQNHLHPEHPHQLTVGDETQVATAIEDVCEFPQDSCINKVCIV